jgi:hypothetical protein
MVMSIPDPEVSQKRLWYASLSIPHGNFGKEATIRRLFKKFRLLTYPTPAAISPARPESAKTASSSRDASFRGQGRSE